jgi:hypothetical protein
VPRGIGVLGRSGLRSVPSDEPEVSEMITGAIAREQIEDRIRQAQAERLAGVVRASRVRRPTVMRRVGSGLLAALASLKPSRGATTVARTRTA